MQDRSACEPNTGCWLWLGSLDGCGYGMVYIGGRGATRTGRAHRVSYTLAYGPIPDGLTLDHLCRVRSCINPDHLEAVTARENILRGIGMGANHARQTHCKRGHELSVENIYRQPSDPRGRRCRACWMEAYREKRDEILAKRRARESANREEINRKRREYRRNKNAGGEPSRS